MPRSSTKVTKTVPQDEPSEDEYDDSEEQPREQPPPEDSIDPKKAQRLAALQKAQASRMAKAELKRKEKALADYESLQRKDEISRKFDELQERLGNKPKTKPQPPVSKDEDIEEPTDEVPAKAKPKKVAPKKKQTAPKPAVVVEESESSSSEDEEPVIVKKKKKRPKAKPKKKPVVVYETESDSDSDDDRYLHAVRSKASQYYNMMFK